MFTNQKDNRRILVKYYASLDNFSYIDNGKENILKKKGFEPKIRFREFGDSALLFELLVWISEPELKGRMMHYLNKAVLEALRREKIEIPYPQRDVHINYPNKRS